MEIEIGITCPSSYLALLKPRERLLNLQNPWPDGHARKSSLLTNIARIADRSVDRREQGFIMQRLPQPRNERVLRRL
jgi:hypothetical protein